MKLRVVAIILLLSLLLFLGFKKVSESGVRMVAKKTKKKNKEKEKEEREEKK